MPTRHPGGGRGPSSDPRAAGPRLSPGYVSRIWITPALLLGGLSLLLAWATGGLSRSFIDPDESAHYVNALFIGDWLRAGMPSPLPFAEGVYQHYPKLSIGHWPPGWYGLLSPIFATLRPSPAGAAALSAFVAGLPALLILHVLRRYGHPLIAWAAAVIYLLLPLVLEAARHFLLDQPVTMLVGLGALAWAAATARPSLPRYMLFAALVAAAALTKGNGLALALVPAIDILLGRRWPLLRDCRLWTAALAAIAVIAPWYLISASISAGGFNYKPGLAYAWEAFRANHAALNANVPLALLAAGGSYGWLISRPDPDGRRLARLCLSVIAAVFLFQSLIPVALAPRYVAPALPWIVILVAAALGGAWRVRQAAGRFRNSLTAGAVALVAAAALAIPGWRLIAMPGKTDVGAPALARTVTARPGIWMVDGRAGGEGAVIAAVMHRDEAHRVWLARSSQWLSASDFMGRGYRLTARSPDEVRAVLDRLGVIGVVVVAERRCPAYPHSLLLIGAVEHPAWAARRVRFPRGYGHVLIAERRARVRPNLDALENRSANAAKLKGTLD